MELQNLVSEAELRALQAQINPHRPLLSVSGLDHRPHRTLEVLVHGGNTVWAAGEPRFCALKGDFEAI